MEIGSKVVKSCFLYKGQRENGREGKGMKKSRKKVFTFSKQSGRMKGHSVNVISISFSHHLFLSLSLFNLFVPLPGDSPNGRRVKEKGRKG